MKSKKLTSPMIIRLLLTIGKTISENFVLPIIAYFPKIAEIISVIPVNTIIASKYLALITYELRDPDFQISTIP